MSSLTDVNKSCVTLGVTGRITTAKLVRWLHSQWVIVAVVNVTYKITMIIGLKERVALVNVTYKITMIIGLKERVALAVGCRGKRHLQNHNDYRY